MAKEEVKKEINSKPVKKDVNKTIKPSANKSNNINSTKIKTAIKKSTTSKPVKKDKNIKEVSNKTNSKSKTVRKTSSKKSSKLTLNKSTNKSTAKSMLSEYYDLPYRYNQTIVKILAQTPTTLFVYWDISDEDRNSLMLSYGENFFSDTRPVLIVHNLTHNTSFEIEINDFANSWYIRTQMPNCKYVIELGRKYNNIQNEYIYINSSNNMISPNNHILFENINLKKVLFKNTKTNVIFSKDFSNLAFINNMDKLYGNISSLYNTLYKDEIFNEFVNPSSDEFYLKKVETRKNK